MQPDASPICYFPSPRLSRSRSRSRCRCCCCCFCFCFCFCRCLFLPNESGTIGCPIHRSSIAMSGNVSPYPASSCSCCAVAVACPFVCHPAGICFCRCCCLFSPPPKRIVISTEALDSLSVQRAVEKPALSEAERDPRISPLPLSVLPQPPQPTKEAEGHPFRGAEDKPRRQGASALPRATSKGPECSPERSRRGVTTHPLLLLSPLLSTPYAYSLSPVFLSNPQTT